MVQVFHAKFAITSNWKKIWSCLINYMPLGSVVGRKNHDHNSAKPQSTLTVISFPFSSTQPTSSWQPPFLPSRNLLLIKMPHHHFCICHSEVEQRVCCILHRCKKKKKISPLQFNNTRREQIKKLAYHPITPSANKFECYESLIKGSFFDHAFKAKSAPQDCSWVLWEQNC